MTGLDEDALGNEELRLRNIVHFRNREERIGRILNAEHAARKLGNDNWTPVRRRRQDYFCQSCSRSNGSLYHRSHREEIMARGKQYYAAHKKENKDARLRRLFGMNLEAYQTLVVRQEGKCAACHRPLGELGDGAFRPVVDHDHKSLKVRCVIHANCNCIIGFAREEPVVLQYLANYLRTNRRF